jgi:chromosome partitioning protein
VCVLGGQQETTVPRIMMKVVTIAAPKGGSGKSTATSVLAARAVEDGHRVAMFDLNADQANLTQWYVSRGEPDNPALFEVENLNAAISQLNQDGFDWLFIDTPPLDIDLIENAVIKSSAVVIPVRASIFDIGAITPIVEICKERQKPFSFLMSAVDNRAQFKKLNQKAMQALLHDGPIFSAQLAYRAAYINALTVGKAGFEIDPDARHEVDALWTEVKRIAGSTAPLLARRRIANE